MMINNDDNDDDNNNNNDNDICCYYTHKHAMRSATQLLITSHWLFINSPKTQSTPPTFFPKMVSVSPSLL